MQGEAVLEFKVGGLQCAAVNDGWFTFALRNFFINAPEDELQAAAAQYGMTSGKVTAPFQCILVRSPRGHVLIDSGWGAAMGEGTGRLEVSLECAGASPDDIVAVIFSHGHSDHTGGALKADGSLLFPKARHFLSEEEREFWFTDYALSQAGRRAQLTRNVLEKLAPVLEPITAAQEILPELRTILAPGHTPHNLALEITSDDDKLLYVADALAHPIHLQHTDWYLEADLDPSQAIRTRTSLMDHAFETGCMVFAYHFPEHPAGRLTKKAGRYGWSAIA